MIDFGLLEQKKIFFKDGNTREISFRIEQLKKLKSEIKKREFEISEALNKDLGKSTFEAYATEIGFVLDEISFTVKNLKKWTKEKKVKTPLAHFPAKSFIRWEPYGVCLIFAPWNYPFQLSISPLIAAIAAGNCAVIKPSEYAENTARELEKLISECFSSQYISVVMGECEQSEKLLKQKFDYIFFTGSTSVGKIVMREAAETLTPVTLELGGKSPCIVDKNGDVDLFAKRIVWGKFLNGGQTCVAPDYVFVHEDIREVFLQKLMKYIVLFYTDNPNGNEDYPKIISQKHHQRLTELLKGSKVWFGGTIDLAIQKISPTILYPVHLEEPIMKEEIFGPILPILSYGDIDEVIVYIRNQSKPLALYLFTEEIQLEKYVLERIQSGGVCINDTIVHLATPYMGFGGIGESGIGSYHGENGFRAFSHERSIMKKSLKVDLSLRYPPYGEKVKYVKWFMK